jgi:hypothetical protein
MGLEGERAQLVPSLLSGVRADTVYVVAVDSTRNRFSARGENRHRRRATDRYSRAQSGRPPLPPHLCDGRRGPLQRSERDDLNTAPPVWSSSKSHPMVAGATAPLIVTPSVTGSVQSRESAEYSTTYTTFETAGDGRASDRSRAPYGRYKSRRRAAAKEDRIEGEDAARRDRLPITSH